MNQLETFLLSFRPLMDPSLSFPGFAAVVLNNFHIDNRRERKGERERDSASFSDIESNFVIAEPRGRFVKHLLSS